jgi:putative inorganic carbon (HCO3(-)) transporter
MSAFCTIFLYASGPGTTGALLYVLAIIAVPLCLLWTPRIGVYLLVPLMPLQTLRYQIQGFPLGDKFMDVLLLSILAGLYLRHPGEFPLQTRLNRHLLLLSVFTYVSLWLGSLTLSLPLPLLPSNERFADWKNYVEMFVLFMAVTSAIQTKRQMKILLVLMMVSVLRANMGFYHTVSERDFSHFDYGLRYAGALGYAGENGLAAFEAQFVLLCLGLFSGVRGLRFKLLIAVSVALALYCLMFSFSRGGYLGLLAGLLFLGLAKQRRYLLVVAVILFSWQTMVPNAVRERVLMTYDGGQVDSSSGERVQLWQDAMSIIPKNPILGTGFDTYKLLGRSEDYTDTHNYYMKITVEGGLVGLVLFLVLLWKLLREGISLLKETDDRFFQGLGLGFGAMVVCVFAVNLFGDRWTFQQVTAYMWVALALVCRARVLNREPDRDETTSPLEDHTREVLATCAV